MTTPKRCTLVFNAGSSSLKWGVFVQPGAVPLLRGGQPFPAGSSARVVRGVRQALERAGITRSRIRLVGHRFVHGGRMFRAPTRLTPIVLRRLTSLDALAPLHNPVARALANAARRAFPRAVQVGVFDTAFFARLPAAAATYALPRAVAKRYGLRRFGFHGLSHAAAAARAGRLLERPLRRLNLITIHLGAGSSAAALRGGRPIETSMGFTPLEGLVMATRAGDLDPGVLLYLLRAGWSVDKLENLLERRSGLRGLTGVDDVRDMLAALGERHAGRTGRRIPRRTAEAALAVYAHRVRKYLGAYALLLQRVDGIVFTGAVGAGSALIRRTIVRGLKLPGRPRILRVPADEERTIARLIG